MLKNIKANTIVVDKSGSLNISAKGGTTSITMIKIIYH